MDTNIRILVVDDQETMRRIMRAELNDLGFTHIETAADGEMALAKIADAPYDLVICDWIMPHMDGLKLLKQIRSMYSSDRLPVLMLTAEARRDNIIAAAVAGANGYIVKPFARTTLERKLDRIFAKQAALAANAEPLAA